MGDQTETQIDNEDLDLIDQALEDEGKDDAELWADIDRSENGAAADDDPNAASPDDESGDDGDKGAEAAATDDDGENSDGSASTDGDKPSNDRQSGEESPDDADGNSQETDLWAEATPEQRAAFDAAQAELKKLQQADRSNRGRLSAMQRQLNDLTARSDGAATDDGAARNKDDGGDEGGKAEGFLASENWKAFHKEYPEVANPLGEIISEMQSQLTRANKELAAIGKDRRDAALDEQYDLLIAEHSDWDEIADDPEFTDWLNGQPRHIREAAYRNGAEIVDAAEAADVIGRYKSHRDAQGDGNNAQGEPGSRANGGRDDKTTQELSGKRKRQLDSASSAKTRSPTGTASGIPEDGDPETIWKQLDEQERRQQRA